MSDTSLLQPPYPLASHERVYWDELYGSSLSLGLASLLKNQDAPLVLITPDINRALAIEYELRFYLKDTNLPLLSFPDWETLPYDTFSPHEDIISRRILTLQQLPHFNHGILIVPINTLMQRLAPVEFIQQHSFQLHTGQTFNLESMRTQLQRTGYLATSQVMEHGQFAVRGSIMDIFPMGSALPLRIDLFDDEIDSIRTFDPESQRSLDKIASFELLPAHEFPTHEEAITLFRQQWRSEFAGNPRICPIYEDVSQGIFPAGIEYYLPLFFQQTATLFDYFPSQAILIDCEENLAALQKWWQDVNNRYQQRGHDITRPLLAPHKILLPENELHQQLKQFRRITTQEKLNTTKSYAHHFNTQEPPLLHLTSQTEQPFHPLKNYLNNNQQRILLCAESNGRREILLELLAKIQLHPTSVDNFQQFLNNDEKINITVALLDRGLVLKEPAITVIVENQLFSQHIMQRRRRRQRTHDPDNVVKDLAELHIGSPVVHLEHGVGRYLGLQTITINNTETEFLTIQYAGQDKLYVPVANLHLISRYSGAELEHAPLNRLGTDAWSKAKHKALQRVRDVAAELLELYAKREARQGYCYKNTDDDYLTFTQEFKFEETPDQQDAIRDVIKDMTSIKPIDRLICGDVGFGKTEVAMRAAFLAVNNGKQVAMLVPTTLLAQQHYQNFRDRFANWPIRIDVLSRFKTAKEAEGILQLIRDHKIDILIGTHKLLQSQIKFADLGLLIIDEEHRFGVRQKERIKALRAEVDILTLTATPIPRTLNLAMSGLRELSIIATPPAKRLSVKTFIHTRDDIIIREAILREIMRGGQVYFLHNKVETIEKTAADLAALVPEAKIRFAHGQMRERELETIMGDFYHLRFNVLVCTTIIETGIDIPTANTIIIDRADHLGLAQLHQLRGRVGRSHHQAYAYLLTPPEQLITADAKKRLEAISSLEDLGIGFTLATHDLEIRGAGELLGEEQSGHIHEIGFSLYMELLERAIQSLKQGKQIDIDEPLIMGTEVDLQIPALIPHDYLPDVHARLMLYKRIANAKDETTLDELQVEMIDRFGLLPAAVKNLILVTQIKLHAEKLGITKIEASSQGGRIDFSDKPNIDPMRIIQLIQTQPQTYKFDGKNRLRYFQVTENEQDRIQFLQDLLKRFI
ncbi:MAG: transcription-repair coupling factor [Legionellales bacterium]|nr:transcription-repair coupling factor [Legionellales bacterium]